MTPHIIVEDNTLVTVTPYNALFLQRIKSSFPIKERKYDPIRRVWSVPHSETNLHLLRSLIQEAYNITPQVFTKDGDLQATHNISIDVTSKYAILKIPETAGQKEIKTAFYSIAKKLHPDVSDADKEFFELAKKAYDTLKDPRKRKKYDLARRLLTSKLEKDTGLRLTSRDLTSF